jgi:hypothetical protein
MLQLDRWWLKALAGVSGATANEILRVYLIAIGRTSGPIFPIDITTYLIVSAIYLLLAAVFTVLWDDPNPIKCFAVGVGLPRIIQSFAENSPPIPAPIASLFS